jgi:SAM-dependent methyltransferase
MSHEKIEEFIRILAESLQRKTFVKMTLGNQRGTDKRLKKILIRPVKIKKGERLFFLYRFDTRDTAKNYFFDEALETIKNLLGHEFFAAHLFTTENDFQLEIGKKNARLNVCKPTFRIVPTAHHNRRKQVLIDSGAFYLQVLGITDERGEVRPKQQDKWRQINKFVEIVCNLFDNSELKNRRAIKIADMGSGKGYLTFAVYDYFNRVRKIRAEVTGIDTREELVSLCNDTARASGFEDLRFEKNFINNFRLENVDILIALHACNTATDEAIFKGIEAKSNLIICAPCCHQELRQQITPPEMLKNVLKHGSLLEREAETLTDGLRALLLERSGYATKVFEFVSTEHTPKNNLIVGTKRSKPIDTNVIGRQIIKIKDFYGVREQRLEKLLNESQKKQ